MGLINFFTKSRGDKSADECCRIAKQNMKEAKKLRKIEFEKRIANKDFKIGDVVDYDDIHIKKDDTEGEFVKYCGRCTITGFFTMDDIEMVIVRGCFRIIHGEPDSEVVHIFALPKAKLSARWENNIHGCDYR